MVLCSKMSICILKICVDRFTQDWLDSRRVSASRAVSMLRPIDNLVWYEVSSVVNNSRNKSENCNKPISKMYVSAWCICIVKVEILNLGYNDNFCFINF